MTKKERITELEAEVARLADELADVEHVEELERQAAALRQEIAAARARIAPKANPFWQGGLIANPGPYIVGDKGPEIVTVNADAFSPTLTGQILHLPRNDPPEPPDMGVPAAI